MTVLFTGNNNNNNKNPHLYFLRRNKNRNMIFYTRTLAHYNKLWDKPRDICPCNICPGNIFFLAKRGHRTCDQSYKINTIIPAITTLYTNMFISLITYIPGPFTRLYISHMYLLSFRQFRRICLIDYYCLDS